uniref:Uncharacterized protein n=1 Tax=Denticeps clupeoides TaxID=299321 RepID=A0AAY4C8W2_9TELE
MRATVLFHNEGTVMGYSIRRHNPGRRSGELFHCLQEMPEQGGANTCHTAGKHFRMALGITLKGKNVDGVPCGFLTSTFFGMILLQ